MHMSFGDLGLCRFSGRGQITLILGLETRQKAPVISKNRSVARAQYTIPCMRIVDTSKAGKSQLLSGSVRQQTTAATGAISLFGHLEGFHSERCLLRPRCQESHFSHSTHWSVSKYAQGKDGGRCLLFGGCCRDTQNSHTSRNTVGPAGLEPATRRL